MLLALTMTSGLASAAVSNTASESVAPSTTATASPEPTLAPGPLPTPGSPPPTPLTPLAPPASGGAVSVPTAPLLIVPAPSKPESAPIQYLSMEELGLLRERTNPDLPAGPSAPQVPLELQQPFRVLGEPYVTPARSTIASVLPRLDLDPAWGGLVLAVALVGLVLIPVLALLTRFVNGSPLFGCEIKALASRSCPA